MRIIALRQIFCVFLLVAVLGTQVNAGEPEFVLVNFNDLATKGAQYDGKRVAVVGYYVQQAPYSILYGEKPSKKNYHGDMLWIGANQTGKSSQIVRKDDTWSIVIGVYKNEKLGIMGQYFGQLDQVVAMYPVEVKK